MNQIYIDDQQYFVTKERMEELKKWIRNYHTWMLETTPPSSSVIDIHDPSWSDPTGNDAVQREQYKTNLYIVESALSIADITDEVKPYILDAACNGRSYAKHPDEYKRFFYYLDRLLP